MIYINIYHDQITSNQSVIDYIHISWPNENDFISDMIEEQISPYNGNIKFQLGVYDINQGFINSSLLIEGQNHLKQKVRYTLPIGSCIITEYFNNL